MAVASTEQLAMLVGRTALPVSAAVRWFGTVVSRNGLGGISRCSLRE
jgi:hypothetical protein